MLDKSKGGYARAASLTPERRSEIARQAALARWKNKKKNETDFKLTKKGKQHNIHSALVTYDPTVLEKLLAPIKLGLPVILKVDDPKRIVKKRSLEQMLIFTPMALYGLTNKYLLANIPSQGSEILDITKPLKSVSFVRLGLNARLASAIADALNYILWRI